MTHPLRTHPHHRWRAGLRPAAFTLLALALLIAALVIPRVAADPFPGATPERALPTLWALALFDLGVALALWRLSSRLIRPGSPLRWAMATAAALLTLQAAAMTDATLAYLSHGDDLLPASTALGLGALACLAVAVVVMRAAWVAGKVP